jgi:hypothetical protein
MLSAFVYRQSNRQITESVQRLARSRGLNIIIEANSELIGGRFGPTVNLRSIFTPPAGDPDPAPVSLFPVAGNPGRTRMRSSAPVPGDPDPTPFPFPVARYPDVSRRRGGPDDFLPGRWRRFPHHHRSRGASGQHRKQTQQQHDHQDFAFHGWSASRPATGPVMMCHRHKRSTVSPPLQYPRAFPWLPAVLTGSIYLPGTKASIFAPPLSMGCAADATERVPPPILQPSVHHPERRKDPL